MKTPELNQAVILAGGLGTRLRPLTDDRPKPMIEINDRPFLAYLLEQLVQQGFTKLVLLLGYLPQKIQEYLGDGSDFGISVTYSISPLHFETGPRLAAALNQLDPYFLLMYCDNYWPFQREAL